MSGSNLLVIFSGSIACGKAVEVVSRLVQDGHRVRIGATAAALRFVGVPLLEGVSGAPVLSDLFEAGTALDHIALTRWADAVVVCPATAGLITRLSAGLAGDLPGALFLAHDRSKPWLVVPAMNPAMWSHPATQASVAKLRDWGVQVLPVASGRTACGELGEGRMLEPPQIVRQISRALARPVRRLRILVTSGGTSEPLDAVRVLTNTSTGGTGALLAESFYRAGHEVLLLRAANAVPAGAPIAEETFGSFAELDAALTRVLAAHPFDAVVHAAAVGDYGVEAVLAGDGPADRSAKLDSADGLTVRLRRQPKLIDALRARSGNPDLVLVGFKLTSGADPAAVRAAIAPLFHRAGADLVVHNDLSEKTASPDRFPSRICPANGANVACATRAELAERLEKLLVNAATRSAPITHSTP